MCRHKTRHLTNDLRKHEHNLRQLQRVLNPGDAFVVTDDVNWCYAGLA